MEARKTFTPFEIKGITKQLGALGVKAIQGVAWDLVKGEPTLTFSKPLGRQKSIVKIYAKGNDLVRGKVKPQNITVYLTVDGDAYRGNVSVNGVATIGEAKGKAAISTAAYREVNLNTLTEKVLNDVRDYSHDYGVK